MSVTTVPENDAPTHRDDAPAPADPLVGPEALSRLLMDGGQSARERILAGVLLMREQPSEAVAAAVRYLLSKIGADNVASVATLLGHDADALATWRALVEDVAGPPAELFSHVRQGPAEKQQVVADLQLFNDVLSASALAGRYWITAGMLLGWAREGDLIGFDLRDYDFAFDTADTDRFQSAAVDLVAAGFLPRYRFPSVLEPFTEVSFARHATKFEFFRLTPDGSDRYLGCSYGYRNGQATRNTFTYRRQPLVPVQYLDRLWLKTADHEADLTDQYGDWRTPDPNWDYMNAKNIVQRDAWTTPNAYDLLSLAVY